ncbi:MAG: bifunctional diaminohydroxyphosphoribosylaminopyrimidine deaminase/5-amino-6-(5-phosphoribosylamino)uracil reductase RibD [Microbacteriaceae bacterium]|jgi:diaminohydroxyphosphoribosylaminopyrimidine deaminase/5-amino-6-(5-phosphoribosylamino)uracil reductase|nr:bifunctional diaminohydroxyphosphoribosylaminopyrimidine deaminase/5-amino-6-(5-phosphoribosylamino)uracil reductase RibD [Microbacteriaceae bacterium]
MRADIVEAAMRRALTLATHSPTYGGNPQVGCVILAPDGTQIGAGYHHGTGTPHAEIEALRSAPAERLHGATAIVTLEPCRHYGHTGPCTQALITAGIREVYYSVPDPTPQAGGGGAELERAGLHVQGGLLQDAGERLLRPWLLAARHERPYVIVKTASTLDGRAAAADGTSQWITGPQARAHAHLVRAGVDAILVGTGTVLADDPSLTARTPDGGLALHQPAPIVLGDRPIPADARVRRHPIPLRCRAGHAPAAVLRTLYQQGMRRVLVEGGPTLAAAFLTAGLADELDLYLAPLLLGEGRPAIGDLGIATLADAQHLTIDAVERLGTDLLVRALIGDGAASTEQETH